MMYLGVYLGRPGQTYYKTYATLARKKATQLKYEEAGYAYLTVLIL
jgi:hypothetical protein